MNTHTPIRSRFTGEQFCENCGALMLGGSGRPSGLCPVLDLDPGLYWDESSRTLEEVTQDLAYWLEEEGLYRPTQEDRAILESFRPDPYSGLIRTDLDPEIWEGLYRDLADRLTEALPDGLWFDYDNDGGGWGVWPIEED